ncbi:MAG: hypothetical protein K6F74_02595 [Prevotella sp.]|nr:hypothetical protein [Prevotella sp.]
MWMMLRVIPIMWRAVRPSKVVDMPAVVNTFWLRKGYEGLTFFGQILAPTQELADRFNGSADRALKNHEMIHLRQAQSCGDSWIRFYLLYIWYWLKGLRMNRQMKHAAYLLNPFEMEAYARMNDLDYLKGPATEWRRYAKMPLKERLKLYKKYE